MLSDRVMSELYLYPIRNLVCTNCFDRNLTRTMTSARRVALYVTPVLLVSSCLNIPKFMETQTSSGSADEQTNGTSSDNTTDNNISK